ncbi:MAG: VOC family protein [Acidobacteriaceae bacterium]|nr:VOC family protein [Acidobacteriaceae bacterium]
MNTDIIIHPKLHHFGLTTANVDAMVEWYRNVLGMTINHRSEASSAAQNGPPFSALAFVSNDEMDHRIVFFEMCGAVVDAEKRRHTGLQHIAFEYATLDDLLGTYVRLKRLGILPVWAADHDVGTSFYYQDPDQNMVEINVNNYGNAWTATERIRGSCPNVAHVDPNKMVAARKAGASPWDLHERAVAGEFAPEKPFDPRTRF